MRTAALDYEHRTLTELDVPEPPPPGAGEVLFRVHEVGICGTDRALASFQIGFPPQGESFLVLGHEALGEIVEGGGGFRRGDWVVPMVRRSCSPPCPSCARGRRDLCTSLKALERGIFGLHGYFTEYALDHGADLVRIPEALVDFAVLIEPLSVVEKAIATALRIHQPGARTALILGAGPIGVLAALALQLRGLEVAVHSLEPSDDPRARLIEGAGARYVGRSGLPAADIVIEATGSPEAAFAGFAALVPLGVYAILGSPNAAGEVPFRDLILGNRVVFGSVNASPDAFTAAIDDLGRMDPRVLRAMIRRTAFPEFRSTIPAPPGGIVKTVHVIG